MNLPKLAKRDLAACAAVFLISMMASSIILERAQRRESLLKTASLLEAPRYVAPQREIPRIDMSHIAAESVFVADDSGQVFAERAKDRPLPIASLTKVMTGYLLMEARADIDVWITDAAKKVEPKISRVPAGMILGKDSALTLLLAESDNDVAEAIADSVGALSAGSGSSREKFIRLMNERARVFGMAETRFTNPTGLDEPGHYSSAQDLFRLARAIRYQNPGFWETTATPPAQVRDRAGNSYAIKSSNLLLGVPGLVGGKTGLTDEARGALLLQYRSMNYPEDVTIVILRSPDRFADGEKVMRELERMFKQLRK